MNRKKMHPRGVNDIMTLTRLPGRNASTAQRASLLARLEQKKVSLETQLRICEAKQRLAERRLRLLDSRIRNVRQTLDRGKPALQSVIGADEPTPAPEASKRPHIFEFSF